MAADSAYRNRVHDATESRCDPASKRAGNGLAITRTVAPPLRCSFPARLTSFRDFDRLDLRLHYRPRGAQRALAADCAGRLRRGDFPAHPAVPHSTLGHRRCRRSTSVRPNPASSGWTSSSPSREQPRKTRPCRTRSRTLPECVIVASQTAIGQSACGDAIAQLPCQPENAAAAISFCVEGKPGAHGHYAFVNMPVDGDGASCARPTSSPRRHLPIPPAARSHLAQQYAGEAIKPGGDRYTVFLNRPHPYYRGPRPEDHPHRSMGTRAGNAHPRMEAARRPGSARYLRRQARPPRPEQ